MEICDFPMDPIGNPMGIGDFQWIPLEIQWESVISNEIYWKSNGNQWFSTIPAGPAGRGGGPILVLLAQI